MTDDRDRRAARDFLRDQCVTASLPYVERDLAALLTAARAEGAAEAIEAAARVADTQAKHNLGMALDNPPDKEWCLDRALTAQVIRDAIHALAPAGLVAVSVDDAETMIEVAECMIENATDQWRRDGWCRVIRAAIDRIRAALARKEG